MYRFGAFLLEPGERRLTRDGQALALAPKAFETLLLLVRNAGHAVAKDELMQALWPRGHVEESNLTKQVWTLRRALGDAPDGGPCIETLSKLGYRFRAPVVEVEADAATPFLPKTSPRRSATPRWAIAMAVALAVAAVLGWTLHGHGPTAARTATQSAALEAAERRLLAGDPVAAAAALRAELRKHPAQAELESALSRALHDGGQDDEAQRVAKQARADARDLSATQQLSLQLNEQTAGFEWAAAQATIAQLRVAAPADPRLALREAQALLAEGQPGRALAFARPWLARADADASMRANWLLLRADADAALADYADEGRAADLAATAATQAAAPGLTAEASLRAARAARHLDRVDAVMPALQRAEAGFDRLHLQRGVAQGQIASGDWFLNHGDLPAANARYADALRLADALGSRALRASALQSTALACWFMGQRDCAEQDAMQALTLYRRTGDPAGQAWSHGALATLHLDAAASDDVVTDYQRAIALSADSDLAYNAWARMSLADVLRLRGQLDDAARACDAAMQRYHALGNAEGEAGAAIACGGIAADRGFPDRAAADFRHARALYLKRDYQADTANAMLALATLALHGGDPARAHDLAEQAASGFGGGGFETGIANALAIELLAELDLGQQAAALQHAAQLEKALAGIDSLQEVMLPKLALVRARASGDDVAGALAAVRALQEDARRRRWQAWVLEARLAELRILQEAGDQTAAPALAAELARAARADGFGDILARLARDRTAVAAR